MALFEQPMCGEEDFANELLIRPECGQPLDRVGNVWISTLRIYLISHLDLIDPFSLHYKQAVIERKHACDLAIITWHIYAHRDRTFANAVNLALWPLVFWIRHRCSQTP